MTNPSQLRRAKEFMTGPLVRVSPGTRARDAERAAIEVGARHLLVFESDNLVGTACICAIRDAPAATRVAERMKSRVREVAASASVFDAAKLMLEQSLSCLPVVDGNVFVGVLTRDDLRRAGVPDDAITRRSCAACQATDHVRADPRGGATRFCSDCLDSAGTPEWHEDLGGGG